MSASRSLTLARRDALPLRRPILHGLIATLVLAFVYGDGVATAIQQRLGLNSPFLVLFPCLALAVLLMVLECGRVPLRFVGSALGFTAAGAALLLFQVNQFDGVNLPGYAQLWLFLLLLLAVAELFAAAGDDLAEIFRRFQVWSLYLGCAYLVTTFLIWETTGKDISLISLITGAPPGNDAVYGFRPRAFAREPAWAAFMLAANYTGVYLLAPKERVRGFIALALAIAALRSGTAFLFVGALVLVGLFQGRGSGQNRAVFLVFALAGVVLLGCLYRGRIDEVTSGVDPSGLMRSDSAGVAWNVVERSFPIGVGYGNFRSEAGYGSQFANYIDLDAAPDYKSDVMVLNVIAELGLAGLLVLGWLAMLAARGRHFLFWLFLAALFLLAGGPLIPSVVLVAAVAGLRECEQLAEAPPPPLPQASRAQTNLRAGAIAAGV
jgi:O-Antigen ligase